MFHITSDNYTLLQLKELCEKYILVGFNIKNYDMKILECIMQNNIPERVYTLSHNIITDQKDCYNNVFFWNKYMFTDLYDDWKNGSLKEFESNQAMDIKESEISFDKTDLTELDKSQTLMYCYHDVEATVALFKKREEYLNAKLALAELFDLDPFTALKSTNAKLASIILKAQPVKRDEELEYHIPDKIKPYIEANLPEEVLNLFEILNNEDKTVRLFDNEVVFGIGGIHSVYKTNIVVKATDKYKLVEYDVRSLYPNLIMNFNFMSRNVPDPDIYKNIYNLRVVYKQKAAEEKAANGKTELYWKLYHIQAGLKLILNTTYGATKNKYNALYDPHIAGSLCYTGQLLLAALANKIYKNIPNCKIIQTNTDGVLIYYSDEYDKQLKDIIQEWEFMTGFVLEDESMDAFYQRDVNNYIELTGVENDPYKLKGKWSNQAILDEVETNLNAPITHEALLEYYANNVPIEKTILNCNDLLKFCFTTKRGKTYDGTYYDYNEKYTPVNKVNRVIATTDNRCGSLYKYKPLELKQPDEFPSDKKWREYCKKILNFETKYKMPYGRMDKIAEIPDKCYIYNDAITYDSVYENLDKSWYITFCQKKIKELEDVSAYT